MKTIWHGLSTNRLNSFLTKAGDSSVGSPISFRNRISSSSLQGLNAWIQEQKDKASSKSSKTDSASCCGHCHGGRK